MVKPVFCLHFVSLSAHSATASNASTIRLKQRERSSGSIGSQPGWWATGRRQSEMTIKGSDHHDQDLEIHFVQGKFALPYSHTSHTTRSRAASFLSAAKVSLPKTLISDSSTWSESDESSKSSDHNAGNLIIGGGDDDLPRGAPEGTVGLVGGTFVVQGVSNPNERDAIAKTLQYLVSATLFVVANDSYTRSNPSRSSSKYLMHSGSLAKVTRHSTTRLTLAQRSRTLYEGRP